MRTRRIALAAVLILAGCGQPSKADQVVDQEQDRPPAATTPAETTVPTTAPTKTKPKVKKTTKPAATAKPRPKKTTEAPDPEPADVYYANCAAVRAAGADPIRRGDPGYSRKLDRDGDGVACE